MEKVPFTHKDYYKYHPKPSKMNAPAITEIIRKMEMEYSILEMKMQVMRERADKYKTLVENLVDAIDENCSWIQKRVRRTLRRISPSRGRSSNKSVVSYDSGYVSDISENSDDGSPSVLAGSSYTFGSKRSFSLDRKHKKTMDDSGMSGPESDIEPNQSTANQKL